MCDQCPPVEPSDYAAAELPAWRRRIGLVTTLAEIGACAIVGCLAGQKIAVKLAEWLIDG